MADPSYQVNRSIHQERRRRYRRHSRLLTLIMLILVAAVMVVGYDVYHSQQAGEKSIIGSVYEQHFAGPQTFKSSYFEFSDTSSWVYAPNDSTPTKLTYLLYEDGVPAHSVTVYVNQMPLQDDLAVNHVLPVQIVDGDSFSVGNVSPACSTLYGPADRKVIKTVSLDDTSFLCVPDSGQYLMTVGQVGGDYNLKLRRSDGQTANYIIVYHNLTADPDPTPFLRIMKTFKAL